VGTSSKEEEKTFKNVKEGLGFLEIRKA